MKKGLSVLLIAAALFGFYGGAVNLNDVLACKDYWEEEGERSTADMNKLEDGLNQLKDNEQAYLDGLDAVADGEDALAQGEADYAEGQATLAKGEADYAAAPAKLRAGEKKLAAGKAAIAKGEKDLASLNTLIDGIEQVLDGYPEWKDGYEQLRNGRVDKVLKQVPSLTPMLGKIQTLLTEAGDMASLKKLGSASKTLQAQAGNIGYTNEDYENFDAALKDLKVALNACKPVLASIDTEVMGIKDGPVNKDSQTLSDIEKALSTDDKTLGMSVAAKNGATPEQIAKMEEKTLIGFGHDAKTDIVSQVKTVLGGQAGKLQKLVENFDEKDLGTLASAVAAISSASDYNDAASVASAIGDVRSILANIHTEIATFQAMIDGYTNDNSGLLTQWINGYAAISDPSGKAVKGQKTLVGGVAQIIGGVLASKNDELISGMNKAASAAGFTPKDFATVASSKLAKDMASGSKLENFYNDMNKIEDGFKKVLPALKNKASDGSKTLNAGKKQVKAGQKELNKGYADYKAAPGKLAAGRAALAEGLQKLMDGRKELAAGKDKLAEYEDGEQQVRDGLATLMGTEPNGGLESILDRRSGDDDFDNGDEHLDLDEGLDAVDVGRGYQADSGELITKEITNRAIGTAAGLGAGALAVLAAILSFLKKNKGSGVCALLSAAAGGAGIAAGTSAGMEFSSIAGSAVGATPWIAFGILAAVAAVHAIAHFASKEA